MFNLGPHEILIGLGSNSSDAISKLRKARQLLRLQPGFKLIKSSPIYRSDALLPPGAPSNWNIPYLNAALLIEVSGKKLETVETARELLAILKEIETSLGRQPSERWAPRPIDLDLLDWGGPNLSFSEEPSIFIPHREIKNRPFVILPAQDCVNLKEELSYATQWRYSWARDVPFKTERSSEVWPELMAIINLTPDSFSDGNSYTDTKILELKIRLALEHGASIIDVGAESTRPDCKVITEQEEFERLKSYIPLLRSLKKELSFKLSLDSRNARTIQNFSNNIELDFLNDVQGISDPKMLEVAKEFQGSIIFMHSLSIPPRPDQVLPPHIDPTKQLIAWGQEKIQWLESEGISKKRLIFDPGIGFGKTVRQNFGIIKNVSEFQNIPLPCLIGHSRKRFLDPFSSIEANERDLETALISFDLSLSGIDYLRIHSSYINRRALQLRSQL